MNLVGEAFQRTRTMRDNNSAPMPVASTALLLMRMKRCARRIGPAHRFAKGPVKNQ